jgi:hypothetical protein
MFSTGQRVVCINDDFPDLIRQIYRQLPVKDKVYTIRAVGVGRGQLAPKSAGGSDGEIIVYLKELHNPDPEARFSKGGLEMGFNSERFAPLETLPDEVVEEELAAVN